MSKPNWKRREAIVRKFINENKRRPSQYIKKEQKCWTWMVRLMKPGCSGKSLSIQFNNWMQARYPTRHYRKKDLTKKAILMFVHQNKFRPNIRSSRPNEVRLGNALLNLTQSSRTWFDAEMKKEIDNLVPIGVCKKQEPVPTGISA